MQPGMDYNYPTSSGNVPAGLGLGAITGVHISILTIAAIIGFVIVWNMGKRRR